MIVYCVINRNAHNLVTVIAPLYLLYYCTKKTLIGLVIRNVIYSRDASLEIPRIYIGMEHEYLLYYTNNRCTFSRDSIRDTFESITIFSKKKQVFKIWKNSFPGLFELLIQGCIESVQTCSQLYLPHWKNISVEVNQEHRTNRYNAAVAAGLYDPLCGQLVRSLAWRSLPKKRC